MPIVKPFRAYRYDPAVVVPESVLTQPYDKISPAMQDRYYASSPYNLVRIILGKPEPGDNEQSGVYSRAASAFSSWKAQGVLRQDPESSVYVYEQRFSVPGDPTGTAHVRAGIIALVRLEDYANRTIFRHEQTLSKPKADRLNLLRATRAHFGQIFLIYDGDGRPLPTDGAKPDTNVTDEYGVEHRLWRISDPEVVSKIVNAVADRRAIIADGHHRYETALAFRNEQRKRASEAGSNSSAPHEYVMATLIDMNSPGLTILPTHRVVRGLSNFETGDFVQRARQNFMFQDVSALMPRIGASGPHFDPVTAQKLLRCEIRGSDALQEDRLPALGDVIMLAVTSDSTFLLYSKPGWADIVLSDSAPLLRKLDVVQLHKIILEKVLGMSEEDIREQRHISYHRDASEAVEQVRTGANVAFLMNPVRMEQLRDIAFSGGVLPQKSTDFYPKLLSGLTIYSLD